jgi:hypothetical protein
MEADDLLCSRNARPEKGRRKGVRSFLCSRSARPRKDLARRPQSKAPHALAWLSIELEKHEWTRAMEDQSAPIPEEITSKLGRIGRGVAMCSFILAERAQ